MQMVVKTIVVRNLFSCEFDGSNPSLPTRNEQPEMLRKISTLGCFFDFKVCKTNAVENIYCKYK